MFTRQHSFQSPSLLAGLLAVSVNSDRISPLGAHSSLYLIHRYCDTSFRHQLRDKAAIFIGNTSLVGSELPSL